MVKLSRRKRLLVIITATTVAVALLLAGVLVVVRVNKDEQPPPETLHEVLVPIGSHDLWSFDGIEKQFVSDGLNHPVRWITWTDENLYDPTPHTRKQGTIPVVHLDGTFGATSPDKSDWHPGVNGPLTFGVYVKPDEPLRTKPGNIFGQYAVDGPNEQRAWLLQFESDQNVICAFRDEAVRSNNVMKPRALWPNDGQWHHLACTFWGQDGVFQSQLLIDGVVASTSTATAPNFYGIRDVARPVVLGTFYQWDNNAGQFRPVEPFYGEIAGGGSADLSGLVNC